MTQSKRGGIQAVSTSIIWLSATGMLAICIPLVEVTNGSTVVPLAVVVGATVATLAVWLAPHDSYIQHIAFADSVQELKQRVGDLEAICSSTDIDLQAAQKQLSPSDSELS